MNYKGRWAIEVDKDQRGKFMIWICKIVTVKREHSDEIDLADATDMLSYGSEAETKWAFDKEIDLGDWSFTAKKSNIFQDKSEAQRRLMYLMWEYKGRYA